jgi:predicted NBD/HSP70 family sugar kinase
MAKVTSPDLMKLNNKRTILEIIYAGENVYRAQIAERTNMSNQTITNLVRELKEERLIKEVTLETRSKGRNPIALSIDLESLYAIGVEISVRGITVGCFNAKGESLLRREESLVMPILPLLKEMVEDAVSVVERSRILGIAVSVEGIVNEIRGLVLDAKNLGLGGINLSTELEYLGIPVQVRNDVNLLAETSFRQDEYKNYMMIRFDRGIGAALVLNGRILRSDNNAAGEFGHAVVYSNPHPKPCKCGKIWCLATEVSIPAIEKTFGMGIEEIARWYRRQDSDIVEEVQRLTRYIAEPLANLITVLDLEKVILTGMLITVLGTSFSNGIEERLQRQLTPWSSYKGMEVLDSYDVTARCAKFVVERFFLHWRDGGEE